MILVFHCFLQNQIHLFQFHYCHLLYQELDFPQFLLKVFVKIQELIIELISSTESVEEIVFVKVLIVAFDLT